MIDEMIALNTPRNITGVELEYWDNIAKEACIYGKSIFWTDVDGVKEYTPEDKCWKGLNIDSIWFDDYPTTEAVKEIKKYTTRFVSTGPGVVIGDNSVTPKHYKHNPYGIECIDAIKAATCDAKGEEAAFQANIIKYIWRYRRKNGIEDLKKAKWYLEELIEMYENGRYKDS